MAQFTEQSRQVWWDSGEEGKNFSHHKARLTFRGQNCIAGGSIGVNKSPSKFNAYWRPFKGMFGCEPDLNASLRDPLWGPSASKG